jgi:hypothetical protein
MPQPGSSKKKNKKDGKKSKKAGGGGSGSGAGAGGGGSGGGSGGARVSSIAALIDSGNEHLAFERYDEGLTELKVPEIILTPDPKPKTLNPKP